MLQGAVLARGPRAVRPGHGGPTTASSPPTSSPGRPEGHAAVSSEAATRMSGLRIGPPGGSCGLGGMPRGRRRSVSEMLGTHRLTPDRYSPRTEPRQGSALPAKGRGELGYTRPRGHRHCLWVPEGGGARPGPLGRGLQPLPPSPMRAGRPRGTRRCHASAPGTRSRGSGCKRGGPERAMGPTAVAVPEVLAVAAALAAPARVARACAPAPQTRCWILHGISYA